MTEDDATLARVVATLKEPVRIDPAVDRRVMEAIDRLPPSLPATPQDRSSLSWLRRRTIVLSPLGGLAAAAVLVLAVVAGLRVSESGGAPGTPRIQGPSGSGEVTQFVLVAPEAGSVAVVGDFNDWSLSATPLARQPGDDVWWVTLPLRPGRYRYAFVVDGTSWRRDANAPGAEDEFGRPNSVVTIGGA